MISIYDYTDYRDFLNAWIEGQKGKAKGLQGKLAVAAGVSSSLISFILKGEKHLSLEQAAEISEFLGLTEKETEYFYLLVECGRAGSVKLQKQLMKRIEEQRKLLANRIARNTNLSDEVKAIYYSNWAYSGIRNLTATPGAHDVQSIAARLGLAPHVVGTILDFLLQNALCRVVDGNLTYGPQRTHVPADSPFVLKHHQNWRLRGFQAMEERKSSNIFFTSPMSLSVEAAKEIQQYLPKVVEQVMAISGPSDSEVVGCFNLDWFGY
jgi:uncharacterized protein (TIGR02147 family)